MHDRDTDATTRVSVASDETPGNSTSQKASISADGRYVSFGQVYADDRNGAVPSGSMLPPTERLPPGPAPMKPLRSATTTRYVVFDSSSTNLVDSDNNHASDIFVRDRQTVPAVPAVYVGNATVHEGDADTRGAVFTVTVAYATVKGTAKPGDFTGKSGTLSFSPGVTSQQVKVPIGADTLAEGNETFTVTLTNVTGGFAYIADSTGVGTIVDND